MAAIRYDIPDEGPSGVNTEGEQEFVNLAMEREFEVGLLRDESGGYILAAMDDCILTASRVKGVLEGVDVHTRSLLAVYAGASADSDYIARMAKDMGVALLVANPAPSVSV